MSATATIHAELRNIAGWLRAQGVDYDESLDVVTTALPVALAYLEQGHSLDRIVRSLRRHFGVPA